MFARCLPLDDPDNVWSYCPSVPAAFILFVLFGLSALLHIYQAIKYRKGFAWVIIMGATWETLSFATRILSAHSPTKKGIYDGSFLLLIISPLLINAFDYMLLGRMVTFFLPDNKLGGIKGSIMGVIFVGCDTISFIVQLGGGLLSLSKTAKTAKLGLHVYTGGVVFQQSLIVIFLILTISFKSKLRRNTMDLTSMHGASRLLYTLRASLALITFRIIFRIVEFSAPEGSKINTYINHHEFFVYAFDAVPMFFALIIMNFWHPGKVLVEQPKGGVYRRPDDEQVLQDYRGYGEQRR